MNKATISIASILAVFVLAAGAFYYFNQDAEVPTNNNEQSNIEPTEQKDVREAVWEQLPAERKEIVNGTWEDGKVSKVTLNEGMVANIQDKKSYEGKEVYLIDFPTKNVGVPNNMIVYADMETFDYIGDGWVD